MVNDRQVLHQLARNCKAGLVGLIRLGQSMQIRPLEIANSKAGLIVLGSLALAWLLPKLESIINSPEEYTLGGGVVSFTMRSPRSKANFYHLFVSATGNTDTGETPYPMGWSPWVNTEIYLNKGDCFFVHAHGSVHTSARRLLAEIDNPAVMFVLQSKYVGPNGTSPAEETPFQSKMKNYRLYPGNTVGFGGLIARVFERQEATQSTPFAVGRGNGMRQTGQEFRALNDGYLQFAVNDIMLSKENINLAREMYVGTAHRVPCDKEKTSQELVKQNFAYHYCLEAKYEFIKRHGLQSWQQLSSNDLTQLAKQHYQQRLDRWNGMMLAAQQQRRDLAEILPDLWYKDNLGGYYVTVKTSTLTNQCPK